MHRYSFLNITKTGRAVGVALATLLFGIGLLTHNLAADSLADISHLVEAVSQSQLRDYLCKLQDRDSGPYCNAQGSRNMCNTTGMNEARDYLVARFRELGLSVSTQNVSYGPYTRQNVIAELPGSGPEADLVVIVGAHYDSRAGGACTTTSAAPGADDNGSGTAAVLEVARVLSQQRFAHTLRFVAFAGEEQGLSGSAVYVRSLRSRQERVGGAIIMDMIGWDGDGDRQMRVYDNGVGDTASAALARQVRSAISQYGDGVVSIADSGLPQSDHASFWSYGYPAILAIEDYPRDYTPYYHSSNDTVDTLRLPYMTGIVRGIVGSVASLAVLVDAPSATPTVSPTHPTVSPTILPSPVPSRTPSPTLTLPPPTPPPTTTASPTTSPTSIPPSGTPSLTPTRSATPAATTTQTATATVTFTVTLTPSLTATAPPLTSPTATSTPAALGYRVYLPYVLPAHKPLVWMVWSEGISQSSPIHRTKRGTQNQCGEC